MRYVTIVYTISLETQLITDGALIYTYREFGFIWVILSGNFTFYKH
jgi:hypothetical protein